MRTYEAPQCSKRVFFFSPTARTTPFHCCRETDGSSFTTQNAKVEMTEVSARHGHLSRQAPLGSNKHGETCWCEAPFIECKHHGNPVASEANRRARVPPSTTQHYGRTQPIAEA